MAHRDIIVAAPLLAIGIGYGFMAGQLPETTTPGTPGPAFFPWLIAAALTGLAAALLARGARGARGEAFHLEIPPEFRAPALMLGLFTLYVGALPVAGFLLTGIPFTAALMWLYGGRDRLLLAGVSIGVPVFLFFLFRDVFQILLPRGVWL